MDNVFNTGLKVDLRYDLKGSLYGRRTIDPKLGYHVDRTVALKDLDLLEKSEKIKVGPSYRRRLLELIKADTKFF